MESEDEEVTIIKESGNSVTDREDSVIQILL